MEKAIDIHNYENDFKTVMVKMRSSDISAKNKNLIEKFGNFCFASSIGKPRVIKYTWTLKKLALLTLNLLRVLCHLIILSNCSK